MKRRLMVIGALLALGACSTAKAASETTVTEAPAPVTTQAPTTTTTTIAPTTTTTAPAPTTTAAPITVPAHCVNEWEVLQSSDGQEPWTIAASGASEGPTAVYLEKVLAAPWMWLHYREHKVCDGVPAEWGYGEMIPPRDLPCAEGATRPLDKSLPDEWCVIGVWVGATAVLWWHGMEADVHFYGLDPAGTCREIAEDGFTPHIKEPIFSPGQSIAVPFHDTMKLCGAYLAGR